MSAFICIQFTPTCFSGKANFLASYILPIRYYFVPGFITGVLDLQRAVLSYQHAKHCHGIRILPKALQIDWIVALPCALQICLKCCKHGLDFTSTHKCNVFQSHYDQINLQNAFISSISLTDTKCFDEGCSPMSCPVSQLWVSVEWKSNTKRFCWQLAWKFSTLHGRSSF